jgi:hypothetical protein
MDRGKWGIGFAVGLVLGVGISMLFLVWSVPNFSNPTYKQIRQTAENDVNEGNHKPVVPSGVWEFYTNPDDSIAQWLMAAFSVLATLASLYAIRLLNKTLIETRNTAKAATDATEIASRQFISEHRPWLKFSSDPTIRIETTTDDDGRISEYMRIECKMLNIGNSPATSVICETKTTPRGLMIGNQSQSIEYLHRCRNVVKNNSGRMIFPSDSEIITTHTYDIPTICPDLNSFITHVCITYFMSGAKTAFGTCVTMSFSFGSLQTAIESGVNRQIVTTTHRESMVAT